jgi:hypothetical protein
MVRPTELVDLIATQQPEATAQGQDVELTAPVIVAGAPDVPGRVRLTLTHQAADYLAGQLKAAAVQARRRIKRGIQS